jgi:hypothetical protein
MNNNAKVALKPLASDKTVTLGDLIGKIITEADH